MSNVTEILAKIQNKQKYAGAVKIKAIYSSKPEFVAKYSGNQEVGLTDSELNQLWEGLRNGSTSPTTPVVAEKEAKPSVKQTTTPVVEIKNEQLELTAVDVDLTETSLNEVESIPTKPSKGKKKKIGVVVAEHEAILNDTSKTIDEKVYLLYNTKAFSVREIAELVSTPDKAVSVHSANYYIKVKHADKTGNEAYKEKFGPGYVWPKKAAKGSEKAVDPADLVVQA